MTISTVIDVLAGGIAGRSGDRMSSDLDHRPAPLFVGDHRAMDFLNTVATPAGKPVDWLTDGVDLVDWLERAGAIDPAVAATFRSAGDAADRTALDAVAGQARSLRDWL